MQIPTSQTIILINFFRYLQSIYFNQLLCRGSVLSKIIHSILQIYRVNIFHKKSGKAPDVYNHRFGKLLELCIDGNCGCISLREAEGFGNQDGKRFAAELKIEDAPAEEILFELLIQRSVVRRRQTNAQLNPNRVLRRQHPPQFKADGEERKDEEAFVGGLVPHIRDALVGKGIILPVVG